MHFKPREPSLKQVWDRTGVAALLALSNLLIVIIVWSCL